MELIELGNFRIAFQEISKESLEAYLFRCGCRTIAWSRKMVKNMDCPAWGTVIFKIVAVSAEQLGFPVVTGLDGILRRGEEQGLKRCFSPVGPLLVAKGGLPKDSAFVVAMDSIRDSHGAGIFEIRQGYLGACHAESNVFWPGKTLFIFMSEVSEV